MLDIQAGRLNLDNAEEQHDEWQDSLLRKGFEVGYVTGRGCVCPKVPSSFGKEHNQYLQRTISDAYALAVPDVTSPLSLSSVNLLSEGNNFLARIHIHKDGSSVPEIITAGWAALPYVSSIELFQYVALHIQGDLRFTDLNIDKGKAVHRDIYVIDCETAQTQVWKAGQELRKENIGILLAENKTALEKLADDKKLKDGVVLAVSPKLLAAIEQLPPSFRKKHDCSGLDIMAAI